MLNNQCKLGYATLMQIVKVSNEQKAKDERIRNSIMQRHRLGEHELRGVSIRIR